MDDLPTQEPIKVYENTYIMKPSDSQRFKRSMAEKIIKEVLEEKLAFTNERDKKGCAVAAAGLVAGVAARAGRRGLAARTGRRAGRRSRAPPHPAGNC